MIGKGRKKQLKLGDVAFLHKKAQNLRVEEIDVGNSAIGEDMLAVRVECMGERGRSERVIMVMVYMTVEDERAVKENSEKYGLLKISREYSGEKVIIMGDMNAHIGVLCE